MEKSINVKGVQCINTQYREHEKQMPAGQANPSPRVAMSTSVHIAMHKCTIMQISTMPGNSKKPNTNVSMCIKVQWLCIVLNSTVLSFCCEHVAHGISASSNMQYIPIHVCTCTNIHKLKDLHLSLHIYTHTHTTHTRIQT